MDALLIYLALSQPGIALPSPTAEQNMLVAKLGHPDFQVREDADKRLEAMEETAYKALLAAVNSPNPEIAFRGKKLLTRSVGFTTTNLPGLQRLHHLKFAATSGRTLYGSDELLRHYWNKTVFQENPEVLNYVVWPYQGHPYLPLATHRLFTDLRMSGFTREDIRELSEAMSDCESPENFDWVRRYSQLP